MNRQLGCALLCVSFLLLWHTGSVACLDAEDDLSLELGSEVSNGQRCSSTKTCQDGYHCCGTSTCCLNAYQCCGDNTYCCTKRILKMIAAPAINVENLFDF